jgi:hypothetical protein
MKYQLTRIVSSWSTAMSPIVAGSIRNGAWRHVLGCLPLLVASTALAIPSFPGAEGFGADTPGGRGGSVYHVTTTNDSGAGSLRTGVSVANRTIVFDVSGTINLASDLAITKSNITVAGQTAPGDGITLMGRTFSVQDTHDVVVRFIRVRAGDVNCPGFQGDSFDVLRGTNVVVDHVTASWSIDECLSPTWSTNVTIQWSVIGGCLDCSCHVKGCHGYGTLMRYGVGRLTLHHNLYAHNQSRNPRPGDNIHLDFVNNVVYNWGGAAGYNANDTPDNPGGFTNGINYVNNYFIAGPSTTGNKTVAFNSGVTNATSLEIYQSGNFIDSNQNSVLDGANTGWSMFSTPYTQKTSPFTAPAVTTNSALVALERVLAFVGASVSRDSVDQTVVNDVRRQTGAIIDSQTEVGGWPVLNSTPAPADTDQDGMPDFWELNLGLNPAVANNNHTNADGYTDLEWYLNWLADPHGMAGVNQAASVNLRTLTGNNTNLAFTVANSTNGSVSLAGDGYTAQFLGTTNFIGRAAFTFNATNSVTHGAFGPVTVTLLVTNLPPAIVSQPAGITNSTGTTATFTVAAVNAALNYQWRKNNTNLTNGGNLSGATSATLTITNLAGTNAGNYTVVITNFSGSITSSVAALVIAYTRPGISNIAFSNGVFWMSITGDSGPDYIVQASTNLVFWESIDTNPAPTPPFFIWSDAGATNFNQRFYRVLLGP